jgi:hypothetical protein
MPSIVGVRSYAGPRKSGPVATGIFLRFRR